MSDFGTIKRGEIYYILKGDSSNTGCEIEQTGRPAIIVSNDLYNNKSSVVEVVFLTTQDKPAMLTHAPIASTGTPSTALCEQVSTISVSRIGDFINTCTPTELADVDRCLLVSLNLAKVVDCPQTAATRDALIRAEAERDIYKDLYTKLAEKVTNF